MQERSRSRELLLLMFHSILSFVTLAGVLWLFPQDGVDARPNFVVFVADDLGFDDLGIHGNLDVDTPVLDALALEAVRFESFYVDPVCAPTRAALFTGRYALRTGVWGVHGNRDYLNLDEQTFADALGNAGYVTGLFGKWHNGVTDGYFPWDRGFDEACMVHLYQYFDNVALCNGQEIQTSGWATARIADWAIDFVERHSGESFALMVPFMAPHLGVVSGSQSEFWHAPAARVQKYISRGLSSQLSHLYGMIDFMDDHIGRVLEALETAGVSGNTVVIFLSDNGPIGNDLMSAEDWNRRNVDGFRGNKGDVYENGILVPLFIRWPGVFAPATVPSALATIEDLFPTLMDLAGASAGSKPIDGQSLLPLLQNPSVAAQQWQNRTLFFTKVAPDWTLVDSVYILLPDEGRDKSGLTFGRDGAWAVRRGAYKYINSYGTDSLFDIRQDPQESTEVADARRLRVLEAAAQAWWDEMLADPGSFSRPVYYIGRSTVSEIFFMGTTETSGSIVVHSHSIEGDVTPGDYLKFRVRVAKSGRYMGRIQLLESFVGEIGIAIRCDEERTSATGFLNGARLNLTISIPFSGEDCQLLFEIEEGSGFFSASSFSFVAI